MKIIDGICYADDMAEFIEVVQVQALSERKLFCEFKSGENRLVDVSKLEGEVFQPIKENEAIFEDVKLVCGAPTWADGTIDLSPEWILNNGQEVNKNS